MKLPPWEGKRLLGSGDEGNGDGVDHVNDKGNENDDQVLDDDDDDTDGDYALVVMMMMMTMKC